MRLQRKGPPDAAHHALTQAAAPGHRARAPVRGVRRRALQSHAHHPFNLRVAHLARGAWPRLIEQACQPPLQEPLAPSARPSGRSLRACPQLPCWDCRWRIPGQSARVGPAPVRSWAGAPNLPASRALQPPGSKVLSVSPSASLPPIRRTLADYNLFNALTTQDTRASHWSKA
jgi:hypothetical protein